MNLNIRISPSEDAVKESLLIRSAVFTEEQGIARELDVDGRDSQSYHILAYADDQLVGTARLTPLENNRAVLSRVAVIKEYRGQGIASLLVKSSLGKAGKLNIHRIELTPHEYLKAFYERFVFTFTGTAEAVSGHSLIKMSLTF